MEKYCCVWFNSSFIGWEECFQPLVPSKLVLDHLYLVNCKFQLAGIVFMLHCLKCSALRFVTRKYGNNGNIPWSVETNTLFTNISPLAVNRVKDIDLRNALYSEDFSYLNKRSYQDGSMWVRVGASFCYDHTCTDTLFIWVVSIVRG